MKNSDNIGESTHTKSELVITHFSSLLCIFRPPTEKYQDTYTCEVESWCPIEVDQLPVVLNGQALMANASIYTVFIKNSVAFPYFGTGYVRSNLIHSPKPCIYKRGEGGDNIDDLNNGCQIFELGKMVEMAGGNFTE